MNRRCMLIILLLCVLKTSGQSDEPTDEDYNGNYDDEFTSESVEVSPSNLSSLTTIGDGKNEQTADEKVNETTPIPSTESSFTVPAAATTTMETHKPIETTAGIELNRRNCPQKCRCTADQVDCSHQNLLQIPNNLPLNTASLNLSHNNLAILNVSDLINYSQLRQLILNDNKIDTIIDTETFAKLPGLHHIDLTNNALKPLQGMEFSKARALSTLILAGNKHVVAPNNAFVQANKLKTLNLSNCSLNNLSDNMFQNLSTLFSLYLGDNPLETELNVNAFKYLVNLRTLYIPKIERTVAERLCMQLESLDMMRLTSETHDLSCFLLTSGSTFDESLVSIGQSTLSTVDNDSDELYRVATNSPLAPIPSILTTTQKLIVAPQKSSRNFGLNEPKVSSQKISPISQNETKIEDIGIHSNATQQPPDDIEEAKVNVSIDMIYLILIVVIAITLVCLIIGMVCRLDCCGIKTKCCRRSHNRAETEDRVRPHEEIPLNKV